VRTYQFAGLNLNTDFPLPELIAAEGWPSITILLGAARASDARRVWHHRWRNPSGDEWMRVCREPQDRIVVQMPLGAEFEICQGTVVCRPLRGFPRHSLRHLLLDQVLPALLAGKGFLVLHASAVALKGRALGFLGPPGAGKSTLAAALTRFGAATVADDALVLRVADRQTEAIPTYPGLRLWPGAQALVGRWPSLRRTPVSHQHNKQRWFGAGVAFAETPTPLAALYLLAPGRTPRIEPVAPREALMELVRFSMMFDPTDRAAIARGFELASRVVEAGAVRRLIVPVGRRALADACAAVRDALLV
jgi:hypothetical protein